MLRVLRMSIVLGMVLATFGVLAAWAQAPSDAVDRAAADQASVPTDALDRGQTTVVVVPTDAHERGQPVSATSGSTGVEDNGWTVSWSNLLLGVAIGIGLVAAGALVVIALRRHPPRGHPPLVHH
jgi:hypothetical protein